MAKQGAQELKDLDVDRVDGVDKPATGRSFLLFKSEDGSDAVLRGYGMTATAGHLVLKHLRTDKNAVMSRKSAIALNGLAQVLGEDAIFVGKSVPTQPYMFSEPDADKRGPADESLGSNFTPRSMPGSMVGSVQFSMRDAADGVEKDVDEEADDDADEGKGKTKLKALKAAYLAAKAAYDEADDENEDEEEGEARGTSSWPSRAYKAAGGSTKAKGDGDADADDDDMDATERANRGVARSTDKRIDALTKTVDTLAKTVAKAIAGETAGVQKIVKGENEPEQFERRPRSRQVQGDDQVTVRKDSGDGRRMNASFSNIAFGADGLAKM